ncbi:TonB-dependent siderophore receptor [Methylotenera sp.]|uniref:TonB-dependent receptor n=1 Tax=Methylotenera sp. TaxID=2051956 RepID=UPI00273481BA|nr:TonB-dependent siderophore receptor [Methylotenera sp.]MDP3210534.1 TonB-dependent siderophore receptor [Methylotenera sp.]MDP3776877.1 TonB-dependent siderophore receptor [Methylotenera sp.]
MQFIGKQIPANQQPNDGFKVSKLKLAIHSVLIGTSAILMVNPLIASAEPNSEITLEVVDVVAPALSDTRPVKGYNAKRSSASTKTDTELRDVPQAISVITQDQIKDQSVQSIAEAVRYVPGVQAAQGEGNRDALIFRGNATTGDFFLDGVRDDVQTYRDVYNTDRVEVLKGPNGMIFGRGGAGGAINRVSKEAGWDPISEVTASYGAYDQRRVQADFGQAINDEVAFRINAVHENSNSYRDGVELKRYGVTPTITVKPTDKTKITLGVEYFKDEHTSDRGVPSMNGAGNSTLKNRPYKIGDTDQFFGNAALSPNETETKALNAMIEHAFDSGLTVRNRLRYADYDKFYQNVFARNSVTNADTVQFGAYRDETDRKNLINQTDLMFDIKTGAIEHKMLLGMELANQETYGKRYQPTVGSTNIATVVSASDPFISAASFAALATNVKSNVDVAAFYLQDQILLTQKWQAIVGLRHDKFATDHTNKLTNQDINVSDSFISPRAGLIFKPVQAVSLYGNYSISYVPRAGDQLTSLTVTNSSFDPEKFINYEVGAKWDANPNLSFTAAVYKLEREKVAATDPADNTRTILIDGQETKGIELSVSGNITDKWSIFGGYAYQDGEITKQQGAGATAILAGTALAQTPDHTFSLWNRYNINDTWGVALGVITRSDMYAQLPSSSVSTILPGYTRFDAAVYGKFSEKLRLQVNLENLTNKEYALYAHNNNNITPGSPITGRATMIYNF